MRASPFSAVTSCTLYYWCCRLLIGVLIPRSSSVEAVTDPVRDSVEHTPNGYDRGVRREIIEDYAQHLDVALRTQLNLVTTANWGYRSNINADTLAQMSVANKLFSKWISEKLKISKQLIKIYKYSDNNIAVQRAREQLESFVEATPFETDDQQLQSDLLESVSKLGDYYNTAVVKDRNTGLPLKCEPDLQALFTKSRDYDELKWAWLAWRKQFGPEVKRAFTKSSDLMNKAARSNGYEDAGDAWRASNYRREDDIDAMTSDLYDNIRPLYEQLHAYTRGRLMSAYPDRGLIDDGPIPAHLLGDVWAQQWNSIPDILTPYPDIKLADENILKDKDMTIHDMYILSENFFTSLGMDEMTSTFWNTSILAEKPGNMVDCHGSAEDFYKHNDFRIMFCTHVNMEDLQIVHHEMGHIQYFMSYTPQPTVYRNGANAAFHEGLGDTIAMSFSSLSHLKKLSFISSESDPKDNYKKNINMLMKEALNKIVILPFALVVDRWRWAVFNGSISPNEYNKQWWKLRLDLQGIQPPEERDESTIDAASKYHISEHVPYIRYFLSCILQYQLHESLCKTAGHTGDLNHCDIYGSQAAGSVLKNMMKMGSSKPWPEAMAAITGQEKFNASSLLTYFKPLEEWLKQQNEGLKVGW